MVTINEIPASFYNSINQWIGFLDDYTLQQLVQRPAKDSWSLGQVYLHLINDTNFFLEQMKTAIATTEHTAENMSQFAAVMFANNSFPDQQMENPFNDINLSQPKSQAILRRQLIAIKEEVQLLFKNDASKSGKTLHHAFGYFSAIEWLQFADMHLRHHLRQKKRIDSAIHC